MKGLFTVRDDPGLCIMPNETGTMEERSGQKEEKQLG